MHGNDNDVVIAMAAGCGVVGVSETIASSTWAGGRPGRTPGKGDNSVIYSVQSLFLLPMNCLRVWPTFFASP